MPKRVVLLCATRRGLRFLRRLRELLPEDRLDVVSFREEPWEPPFLDDIAAFCQGHDVGFLEARRVGHERLPGFWDAPATDLILAVNWRYLVDEAVLARPVAGAYVFHDSLLPSYRGFSPTVWAIINGEQRTGVTLAKMGAAVDAGGIVDQAIAAISLDDTIATVMQRVEDAYVTLLERHLDALLSGRAVLWPQDHTKATYACKRLPEDNEIIWSQPTRQIYNLIRAVTRPYPGAYTWFKDAPLRVWAARELQDPPHYVGRVPGRVVDIRPGEGVVVLTGDGCLLITQVEPVDGPPQCPAQFVKSVASTFGRKPSPGGWRRTPE